MLQPNSDDLKILVADDEDTILELYEQVLGQSRYPTSSQSEMDALEAELFGNDVVHQRNDHVKPSFDLTFCHQGSEAIEAVHTADAEGHPYAIAFLDVRMPPGPDGIWTAENIRAVSADTQIVIVTGYTDIDPSEIERRIQPANRLLYIQKPFHLFEIRQFVSTLAARWKAERQLLAVNQKLETIVEQRTAELKQAYADLKHQAAHDSLTGLPNRATIFSAFNRELARANRMDKPTSIIMADIDYFKRINDTFGHQAGDVVLAETARRIQNCVRAYDTVGRFGGEEFLVILPECDQPRGKQAAQRIRAAVSAAQIEVPGGKVSVTISLGVATIDAGQVPGVIAIIKAADTALYRAKNEGRNAVRMALPDDWTEYAGFNQPASVIPIHPQGV